MMTGRPAHEDLNGDAGMAVLRPVADIYNWAFEQAAHIRAGRFDHVDIANVAEEIETVGRSEYSALVNDLAVLLQHMLKWDFQPARISRSWSNSIFEHRRRIVSGLKQSPSLRSRIDDILAEAYDIARANASTETDLPRSTFPFPCPYDWTAIMDRPFAFDPE